MKDRVTAGFVAGIAGGIGMNVIDWIVNSIYGQKEYLYCWASVVLYGRLPRTTWEVVFSQIGQIFFAGILGIIFAYMLLKLTSGNYLIKGCLYGFMAWFVIYGMSIIFRLRFLDTHSAVTITSHFFSSLLYGLIVAEVLRLLSVRKQV